MTPESLNINHNADPFSDSLPQMLAEDEEVADDDDVASESSYTSSEDDEERRQLLRTDFQSFSP